jgi:hypothetical protein
VEESEEQMKTSEIKVQIRQETQAKPTQKIKSHQKKEDRRRFLQRPKNWNTRKTQNIVETSITVRMRDPR